MFRVDPNLHSVGQAGKLTSIPTLAGQRRSRCDARHAAPGVRPL